MWVPETSNGELAGREPGLRPHPGVPHPVPPGTVQKLRHVGAATAARKVNGQ